MQLFCDAKREEIKATNPGAGFGETGKLLATAWKECSSEDKAKLQQQSKVRRTCLYLNQAADALHAVIQYGA